MTRTTPGRTPDDGNASPAPGGFRPHGRTEMWADGALVHVAAEGPFNREGVDAFSLKMVELYRQLPAGQRFVNITEITGTMIATPEAWERLSGHLAAMNASGLPLVATAWVAADDLEGRSLFMPRATRLFETLGRRFAVFASMAEAEAWARAQLTQ